ncbi:MAG: hypothetical protein ABII97_01155 [Patescibacteria group bacterium]
MGDDNQRKDYKEFEKRIKETVAQQVEEKVAEEVEDWVAQEVEEAVSQEVPAEVSRQMERLNRKIALEFNKFQSHLKSRYNFVYASLVISGGMLFWFGAWRILNEIEIFKNGIIPLLVGALFLFITGTLYHKFVE